MWEKYLCLNEQTFINYLLIVIVSGIPVPSSSSYPFSSFSMSYLRYLYNDLAFEIPKLVRESKPKKGKRKIDGKNFTYEYCEGVDERRRMKSLWELKE